MYRSLEVFSIDRTKNGEVTRFALLELEINRHTRIINIVVTVRETDKSPQSL